MTPEPKKLSRARRLSRVAVWTTFAVVVSVRLIFFPPWQETERPRAARERGERFRRPPADLRVPVAAVPEHLRRIEIEVAPGDVEKLRGTYWGGRHGGPSQRPEVLATVREGSNVYTNVALHLKGAAGSFRHFDDKPALTLNFSKRASGQQFHGYTKISLNNSVQDPTYLCEAISRELFLRAEVPVPAADHATVLINGRDLGLYVLVEGFGKTFLKRHFTDVGGNLYDGGFCQEVNDELDTNSGDRPEDRSDIRRLLEAAETSNTTNRWERLSQILDMNRFISFVAMEIMTCHWDGYALNRNNYRLFHDRKYGRMVFMPHGLDQMFGTFRSSPSSSIEPEMQGFVAHAVVSTPQGRRLLLDRIGTLRTNVFVEEWITNRVQELSRRIRPTLAAYGADLASSHDRQVAYLCERISERAQSITQQLGTPRESLTFDESGVAVLSGWAPRMTEPEFGTAKFERLESGGSTLLHIASARGGGSASWRTRTRLEDGQYRFTGRVRARNLGRSEGVCLRVSGARAEAIAPATDQWTDLSFRFRVGGPMTEIELVCELRASGGEAWFDAASLRLKREE